MNATDAINQTIGTWSECEQSVGLDILVVRENEIGAFVLDWFDYNFSAKNRTIFDFGSSP